MQHGRGLLQACYFKLCSACYSLQWHILAPYNQSCSCGLSAVPSCMLHPVAMVAVRLVWLQDGELVQDGAL
jgi:hypothetical protein